MPGENYVIELTSNWTDPRTIKITKKPGQVPVIMRSIPTTMTCVGSRGASGASSAINNNGDDQFLHNLAKNVIM